MTNKLWVLIVGIWLAVFIFVPVWQDTNESWTCRLVSEYTENGTRQISEDCDRFTKWDSLGATFLLLGIIFFGHEFIEGVKKISKNDE